MAGLGVARLTTDARRPILVEMDNAGDLRILLSSRYPVIVAEAREETRFLDVVRTAARELGLAVWVWSATRGLARDGQGPQYGTAEAPRALDFLAESAAPGIFVFADAQHALTDLLVVRRLKELAQQPVHGRTIVLACPRLDVPPDLADVAVTWRLKGPGPAELEDLVRRTKRDLRDRGLQVRLADDEVASLVDSLRGLTTAQAERLVQEAAIRDGSLDAEDLAFVRSRKVDLLGLGEVLELIESDLGTLDDVGGMDALKAWLTVRRGGLDPDGAAFGLDPPRGVLITGVPGCGKSLVAKTLARTWGLPLLLLDPARLYGPYIGESERRLDDTLRAVDAMAPCVVWIDEIEKGFAASDGRGDSGVSRRLLGTFLRWLQDRPPGVFVAATCNDVSALPPELGRKGRFDEIFFVDLPGPDERTAIWRVHLSRRERDPASFDVDGLVAASEGFSGAEVEAAVVGALYRAFASGEELTTEGLVAELEATVPLSRTRAEEIQALRAWAAGRAVAAGGEPVGA